MSDERRTEGEKTRVCPSCRMEINVLATKCRFCGEAVGRPKREEARRLTVQDLGGESSHHYSPSEDMLNALESFRAEESARRQSEERQKPKSFVDRLRGRQSDFQPENETELPQFSPESQALASLFSPAEPAAPSEAQPLDWTHRLAYVAAFVLAVLVLYFGAIQMGAMIREFQQSDAPANGFVSQAPALIEQGAPAIEVLEAAETAVRHSDTGEHLAQLEQARRMVRAEVEALLNADPWEPSDLQRASSIAHQAMAVDSGAGMRALRKKVNEEIWAYNIILQDVESDEQGMRATLRLVQPQRETQEVTVRRGDMIDGRFRVLGISRAENRVRVEDTLRDGRRLSCTTATSLR